MSYNIIADLKEKPVNALFGMERIHYQPDKKLGKLLEDEITAIRKNPIISTETLTRSKLSDIIYDHLGFKPQISLSSENGEEFSMFVVFPILNTILFDVLQPLDLKSLPEAENRYLHDTRHFWNIEGSIDLKTGRIFGELSQALNKSGVTFTIGKNYLVRSKYTASETAALLLHECGHVIGKISMALRLTKTALIMEEATRRLLTANSPEIKIKILNDIEDKTRVKFNEKNSIAGSEGDATFYYKIVYKSIVDNTGNQLELSNYSQFADEQLADRFTAMHGYAVPLATALQKFYKYSVSSLSKHSWYTINLLKLMGGGFIMSLSPIISMIVSTGLIYGAMTDKNYMPNMSKEPYENNKERILKLQQQVNFALKSDTLSSNAKRGLVVDWENIKEVLDKQNDNQGILEFVYNYVIPKGRRVRTTLETIHEMERLYNNDLFMAAAALKLNK